MRRDSATIGHKTISYLIEEPAAPATRQRPVRTVVFLHAFPLQAAMWEPTLSSLPEGWRAVAPDLRGLGQTSLPSGPDQHRISDMAGDVVDVLDHLGVTHAAAVGCSMGGYVLFELVKSAHNYVSALGLVSTRAGADSEEGRKNREKMIETIDRDGVEAVADQMVPKLLGATSQKDRPDLVKQVRNLVLANGAAGVKAAVRAMMQRADFTSFLSSIDVPALIVHGGEDTLIPPAEAEAMHRGIRNSRLEILPQCGHLPNLEQTSRFQATLWQFLEQV